MTKHEPNLSADQTADPDLERRVEAAILEHMAQHDGAMPTINALNVTIKTSNSRLCPVVRTVKARLMAVQTKLSSMPDIPEALTLAHEQALKEMWAKAREYQNEEIVDLKRSQAARDAMYRDEVGEMQDVIFVVETSEKAAHVRADTAEADLAATQKELEATRAALAAVKARLDEQDKILALFAARMAPEPSGDEPKAPTRKAKKSGPPAAKPDEPETYDLPGVNLPADADAGDPS
jgi:ribosomal protein L17